MSICVCKPAKHCRLFAINDTISLGSSVNLIFIAVTNEPKTYYKALCSPYLSEWKYTIKTEYTQLLQTSAFEWVNESPAGKKAVGSHIIFKKKLNEHSNCIKFKTYIVAKGFSQVFGENFSETFSSVAKFTILQIFLVLAAYLDFEIYQVDIVAAYLQDNLDKEIYITILDGFSQFGSEE